MKSFLILMLSNFTIHSAVIGNLKLFIASKILMHAYLFQRVLVYFLEYLPQKLPACHFSEQHAQGKVEVAVEL
jgi:hypothetical protein